MYRSTRIHFPYPTAALTGIHRTSLSVPPRENSKRTEIDTSEHIETIVHEGLSSGNCDSLRRPAATRPLAASSGRFNLGQDLRLQTAVRCITIRPCPYRPAKTKALQPVLSKRGSGGDPQNLASAFRRYDKGPSQNTRKNEGCDRPAAPLIVFFRRYPRRISRHRLYPKTSPEIQPEYIAALSERTGSPPHSAHCAAGRSKRNPASSRGRWVCVRPNCWRSSEIRSFCISHSSNILS